jgi:TetR/AcrR family transcriptional repressor of bet genes
MSPRPRITDVRREEIVRAALEVISQRGFQDTRIADIAERARTSAPAVLYHFESKSEILDAVVSLAEDRFYDGVEATLAEEVGPAERLVRFLESAARDDDGEATVAMWRVWLEIWTRALRERHTARTRRVLDRRWRSVLTATIAEGTATGAFSPTVDAATAALTLASLMDGLAVQFALADPEVGPEVMTETLVLAAERILDTDLSAYRLRAAEATR